MLLCCKGLVDIKVSPVDVEIARVILIARQTAVGSSIHLSLVALISWSSAWSASDANWWFPEVVLSIAVSLNDWELISLERWEWWNSWSSSGCSFASASSGIAVCDRL